MRAQAHPTLAVPTWVWVVLGTLGVAVVAVTLGLFVEARDASANADDISAEASQLLDDLVADVKTTNDELSTFNEQFESAVASAQAAAAEAKQKQSERSSSRDRAHDAGAPHRSGAGRCCRSRRKRDGRGVSYHQVRGGGGAGRHP